MKKINTIEDVKFTKRINIKIELITIISKIKSISTPRNPLNLSDSAFTFAINSATFFFKKNNKNYLYIYLINMKKMMFELLQKRSFYNN